MLNFQDCKKVRGIEKVTAIFHFTCKSEERYRRTWEMAGKENPYPNSGKLGWGKNKTKKKPFRCVSSQWDSLPRGITQSRKLGCHFNSKKEANLCSLNVKTCQELAAIFIFLWTFAVVYKFKVLTVDLRAIKQPNDIILPLVVPYHCLTQQKNRTWVQLFGCLGERPLPHCDIL